MTVVGFDPLRAAIESSSRRAMVELDRAAELGELTPELAEALEQFATTLEICDREAERFGLPPRGAARDNV